jgi:hypothetical protein
MPAGSDSGSPAKMAADRHVTDRQLLESILACLSKTILTESFTCYACGTTNAIPIHYVCGTAVPIVKDK